MNDHLLSKQNRRGQVENRIQAYISLTQPRNTKIARLKESYKTHAFNINVSAHLQRKLILKKALQQVPVPVQTCADQDVGGFFI
jgi:hypothetical protein